MEGPQLQVPSGLAPPSYPEGEVAFLLPFEWICTSMSFLLGHRIPSAGSKEGWPCVLPLAYTVIMSLSSS